MSELLDKLNSARESLIYEAQILAAHFDADDALGDGLSSLPRAKGAFRAAVRVFEAAQKAYIVDGLKRMNDEVETTPTICGVCRNHTSTPSVAFAEDGREIEVCPKCLGASFDEGGNPL